MGEVVRYSEREQAWQRSELRVKNEQQLAQGFHVADIYLNRTYLDQFSSAPIIAANRAVMDVSKLRIIEISKLVFDASERFTDKLMSVYSAIYNLDSSVALIISSDGNKVRFYIGTRSDRNTAIAGDILEATLKGNFPGIVYKSLDAGNTSQFVAEIKNNGVKSMAAVSVVPSIRENSDGEMEEFVQGIEKFIDTMSGRTYTMVCLATPVNPATMQKRKHGFEELCSSLSPHAKLSVSVKSSSI